MTRRRFDISRRTCEDSREFLSEETLWVGSAFCARASDLTNRSAAGRASAYLPQVPQPAAREAGGFEARARGPGAPGTIPDLGDAYRAPSDTGAVGKPSDRGACLSGVGGGRGYALSAAPDSHPGATTSRRSATDGEGGPGPDATRWRGRRSG
jgi:hypothetical protein